MSTVTPRPLSALALAAAAVLLAGCASTPDAPTSPGSHVPSSARTAPADPGDRADPSADDVAAAWLEDGRSFAVVTWGSSSCRPHLDDVSASGQQVTVVLAAETQQACTDDLAARALYAPTPQGVDVTKDVEVTVVAAEGSASADLAALPAAPQGEGRQEPSAGWFADDAIALLTWGSSTCPPLVEDVETTDAGARVTFAEDDRICTMDLVPRVTPITMPAQSDRRPGFELVLIGNGMDATIPVLG